MKNKQMLPVTLLLLGLVILITACSNLSDPEQSGISSVQVTADGVEASQPVQSADAELATLGGEIPGFGGLFYDEQGNLNVYVKQDDIGLLSRDLEARLAGTLAGYLNRPTGSDLDTQTKRGLKVLDADYNFYELLAWRSQLDAAWSEGMTLTDVDEKLNRVRVGVEDAQAQALLERRLAQTGIPAEAVVIEKFSAPTPTAGLRERVRPLIGGVEIPKAGFVRGCTLGFNVTLGGTAGFVTASHCTNQEGGVEGTRFTQGGEFIGTETIDPEHSPGNGCPAGRRCRISDSAFVASDAGRRGYIAWTRGENNGDLEIAGQLRVIGVEVSSVVGEELEKIGAASGRTRGNVTSTCVTLNSAPRSGDKGLSYVCQDITNLVSRPGDSGSPVFRYAGNGEIYLRGVVWAIGNGISVFSPIDQIFSELAR